MKTIDQYFTDWESHVFGYGYGTGEPHVFRALRNFFCSAKTDGRNYDYEELERGCTPEVAWLLINALAHADVIEYGTSPRYGWFTDNGRALAEYVRARSVDQLIEATDHNQEYVHCFPDYCNCVGGKGEGCRALNPFWSKWRPDSATGTPNV